MDKTTATSDDSSSNVEKGKAVASSALKTGLKGVNALIDPNFGKEESKKKSDTAILLNSVVGLAKFGVVAGVPGAGVLLADDSTNVVGAGANALQIAGVFGRKAAGAAKLLGKKKKGDENESDGDTKDGEEEREREGGTDEVEEQVEDKKLEEKDGTEPKKVSDKAILMSSALGLAKFGLAQAVPAAGKLFGDDCGDVAEAGKNALKIAKVFGRNAVPVAAGAAKSVKERLSGDPKNDEEKDIIEVDNEEEKVETPPEKKRAKKSPSKVDQVVPEEKPKSGDDVREHRKRPAKGRKGEVGGKAPKTAEDAKAKKGAEKKDNKPKGAEKKCDKLKGADKKVDKSHKAKKRANVESPDHKSSSKMKKIYMFKLECYQYVDE